MNAHTILAPVSAREATETPETPKTPKTPAAEAVTSTSTTPRTYAGGIGHIRMQLDAMMARKPTDRIERLFDTIVDGEIDGASYRGHARCPLGWLGIAPSGPDSLPPDDTYLVEGFAFHVMPGQTPETSGRLRRLESWVAAALAQRYDVEGGMVEGGMEASA